MSSNNNILSIDVEEIFHAEYVKDRVRERKFRAPDIIDGILDLLESIGVKATFFMVGEIAEEHPEILHKIRGRGHEVGFHGYHHDLLERLTPSKFREEVERFDRILQSTLGERCHGFRAPSLSLKNETLWALEILIQQGYHYDSSLIPAWTPLYGNPEVPRKPYKPSIKDITKKDKDGKIWEFPLTTYGLGGLRMPVSGGFFLRLLPLSLIEKAFKKANSQGQPGILYIHTWELDPETPRYNLGWYRSFITYHNLEKTQERLAQIVSKLPFTNFEGFLKEMVPTS